MIKSNLGSSSFGAASFWVSKQHKRRPQHALACFGAASFWVSKQLLAMRQEAHACFGAASFWVSKQHTKLRFVIVSCLQNTESSYLARIFDTKNGFIYYFATLSKCHQNHSEKHICRFVFLCSISHSLISLFIHQ